MTKSIVGIEGGKVRFRWKDYRHNNRQGVMELEASEFIRRFLLHVLPSGFQRIRHYGLLSNRQHATKLARCRELLGVGEPVESRRKRRNAAAQYQEVTGEPIDRCPACRLGRMRSLHDLAPASPTWNRPSAAFAANPPDSS